MKVIAAIFLLFYTSHLFSQNSIGAYVNPNFQITSLSESPSNLSDSLNNLLENDRIFSFGLEFRKQIDRDQAISFNPGFYQESTLFVLRDLQLFDVIHPSLPEIRDQAQASSKIANLHYRYKYLSAQVQYTRRVPTPYRKNSVSFEYNGAITYLQLLSQDIRLQTEGFALQGDFVHIIKEQIFFEGRKHNIMLSAGFDVVYPINPDLYIFAGAQMGLPMLSLNTNLPSVRNLNPGLKIGLRQIL